MYQLDFFNADPIFENPFVSFAIFIWKSGSSKRDSICFMSVLDKVPNFRWVDSELSGPRNMASCGKDP